jgi:hypothetical protein
VRHRSDPLAPPLPRVDWRLYFHDFCEAHGKFPMELDGKLVFPDGWSYSATDYMGPEWPPPADPREKFSLLLRYWKRRLLALDIELRKARIAHETAERLVATRSATITVYSQTRDPETGKVVTTHSALDLAAYRDRVEWLERDTELATEQLKQCILELRLLRMPRGADEQPERAPVEQAR